MKKIVLFCALALAACGFRPIFSGQNTDIYVRPISGINGIELRNRLNTQFGGMHDPSSPYTLTVTLRAPTTQYKALEQTGDATWQQISLTANYVLSRGDTTIAQGTESASESYTFVRYLVASNASYNNAVQNILQVLATKISARAIAAVANDGTGAAE